MKESEEQFTTEQVADIFMVQPNTVRQWVKRDALVPLGDKKGKSLLFSKDELTKLANRKYGNVK